jgi:hypothetical protein
MKTHVLAPVSKYVFACVMLMCATGCASIVKGTTQDIPMTSVPAGADVLVDGSLVGQTPLKAQLKRKNDHLVTIQKTGYQTKTVAVVKDVGGAVWGNILLGGLIGWGVDASTGAQYNLTPKTISIELERAGASDVPTGPDDATQFVTKLRTLDEIKEGKQISDEEYGKARIELFRKYMPEALPEEARNPAPPVNAAPSQEATPPVAAAPSQEATPPVAAAPSQEATPPVDTAPKQESSPPP